MGLSKLFKIIVVGDGGIGKSTMIRRLTTGTYIPMRLTVGADMITYLAPISDDKKAILQIWDFGGQKRFRFFLPDYCKGAIGCLLCYDITRYQTFEGLEEWFQIVNKNADDPIFILVGTKHDLADDQRIVRFEDAIEFKKEYGIAHVFESSSVSGFNIEIVFDTLAKAIAEKKELI